MKYKYLTLILFFPFSVFSQILWDNFEDTRIGYYEFVHGGMTTRFENPIQQVKLIILLCVRNM